MRLTGKDLSQLINLEEEFFDIDKENNLARITIEFKSPSEILEVNYKTKIPVLNDEFIDWIHSTFAQVSSKYKVDVTIMFDDMEGYTSEELENIFAKNIGLEFKTILHSSRRKRNVALLLVGIGVLSFVAMMLISKLWVSESIWRDIFIYISDIATTVTFWEAMTILIVEGTEERAHLRNLAKRFNSLTFKKKGE